MGARFALFPIARKRVLGGGRAHWEGGVRALLPTSECLAKKRKNRPELSIKPKTQKEKTDFKLITEPAFLPNTCYVRLWVLKTERDGKSN